MNFLSSLPQSLPVKPCTPSPDHIFISNASYFSIFLVFGGGLYFLLLLSLTLRQKQIIATPLLFGLAIAPMVFSTEAPVYLIFSHIATCGCVLQRHIDLYFIRPWRTGQDPTMNLEDWMTECWAAFRKIPMSKDQLQRYELELQQESLRRELELKNSGKATPEGSTKGKPTKQFYTPRVDPNPKHWTAYLPRWIGYAVAVDVIAFSLSFFTAADIESSYMSTLIMRIFMSMIIIFDISLSYYTTMIIWAATTGNLIHNTEWTLVTHYFPGFATSPSEFWRQWHQLFKYIWVDLGSKTTHHIIRRIIAPKVANRRLVAFMDFAFPMMGVFVMSGLMHEFIVMGLWHTKPGSMTVFFLLHGAGTVVSKMIYDAYGKTVYVPPVILILMNLTFNFTTAYYFMAPFMENEGHNLIAGQSGLVHGYNYLRANGVF